MIWIFWLAFILSDAYFNAWRERNKKTIYHGVNDAYRIVIGGLFILFDHLFKDWKLTAYFLLGGFFSFWLIFNLAYNKLMKLPIDHLGTRSLLDRFEALLPVLVWDVWKIILSVFFIYAYYNQLLS